MMMEGCIGSAPGAAAPLNHQYHYIWGVKTEVSHAPQHFLFFIEPSFNWAVKNKFLFTMTAYTGQTRATMVRRPMGHLALNKAKVLHVLRLCDKYFI